MATTRVNYKANNSGWHDNHGSAQDFTTFFFSNFPNGYGEVDMFKVFQRRARVKEVFIARRLNKWGRRFGFVRFFDVRNVRRLERELDQMYVGNKKLFVNVPKYRRNQRELQSYERMEQRNHEIGSKWVNKGTNQKEHGAIGRKNMKEVWVEKKSQKSYAEAVKGAAQERWKGPIVRTQQHTLPWMKRSVVGQLKEDMRFNQLGEELVKEGMNMVRARYMGGNLALLTPMEGVEMKDLILHNKSWFNSIFVTTQPWTETFVADHRFAWIRCYGLPFPLWNKECFEKVLGEEASLVSIDMGTLTWEILEYARLQVRTIQNRKCTWMKTMKINESMYNIVMEEETPTGHGDICKCITLDSSDSICSSDTYVEDSQLSVKSYEEERREWEGESSRRKGVDDDVLPVDGGAEGTNTTNLLCKEKPIGSSVSQGKRCPSFTEEEAKGQTAIADCEQGAIAYAQDCKSHPIFDDLARLVVESEFLLTPTNIRFGLGQEEIGEAQLGKEWASGGPNLDHGKVDVGTCGSGSEKVRNVHEGGDTQTNSGFQGAQLEGNEVNETEEACDSLIERNWASSSTKENAEAEKKRMGLTQHDVAASQRRSEGDEGTGGNSVNSEAMHHPGMNATPTRQRKEKGLSDLRDACSMPRRSERISKRQFLSGPSGGMNFPSLSDGDINKCNLRICDQGPGMDSSVLWDIGKIAGLACRGEEEEVINEYLRLEERDTEYAKGVEEGDKDVPS